MLRFCGSISGANKGGDDVRLKKRFVGSGGPT
jgi:hypothetical protein